MLSASGVLARWRHRRDQSAVGAHERSDRGPPIQGDPCKLHQQQPNREGKQGDSRETRSGTLSRLHQGQNHKKHRQKQVNASRSLTLCHPRIHSNGTNAGGAQDTLQGRSPSIICGRRSALFVDMGKPKSVFRSIFLVFIHFCSTRTLYTQFFLQSCVMPNRATIFDLVIAD